MWKPGFFRFRWGMAKILFPTLTKTQHDASKKQRGRSATVMPAPPENNDGMNDEELITLFGRLSLEYNHLAERPQASAITAAMNISTSRMKQVAVKIPPFVNDRLSLGELCEAAKSYCIKAGISGRLTAANWTAIANALCISPGKFEDLGEYITSQSKSQNS